MSPQICQMASYLFACFVLTAIPERDSRSLGSQTILRSCRHCALTFSRQRPIENEQTIDILGSEAKAEHASPQGGRRGRKGSARWREEGGGMKKMRSRQLLNIKLIEQLIKTPSSSRSSNTWRDAAHRAQEQQEALSRAQRSSGWDCECNKRSNRKQRTIEDSWSTGWLTDWKTARLTGWLSDEATVWKDVIKASESTWNYEVEKLIQRQVEKFELSIMWKAASWQHENENEHENEYENGNGNGKEQKRTRGVGMRMGLCFSVQSAQLSNLCARVAPSATLE